jgi:hypothetical protein
MSPKRPFIILVLFLGAGAIGACGKTAQAPKDAGALDLGSMTLMQSVAAIVIPKCAVAGCHDAVSKTHSMDLSTPEKIHSNWVDVRGFDHCTGLNTPRVIPADPDGSLVILKIEGIAVCAQSNRMPLPPRDPLTAQELAVIRAWIAAGAPSDQPPAQDGGAPDGGAEDANAGDDAGGDDAGTDDDGGGPPGCSSTNPCPPDLTCSGVTCGGPWECVAHFDDTLEHPCEPETIQFCGCDGVTFEASFTCPDRPWVHAGACDDGVNCTDTYVECADPKPTCASGQAPSVIGACWGPCVPDTSCRCLYHWMCPNLDVNTCLPDYHCGPRPTDGGMSGDGP